MNDDIKEFVNQNCLKCKEPCEKGIHETAEIIKCADTGKNKNKKCKKVLTK